MSFTTYESVDYTYVINRALLRVSEARASIDTSMKHNFDKSINNYYRAVEALLIILLPHLRPNNYIELMNEVKESLQNKDIYALEVLDKIIEEILVKLNQNRLLMRGEVIRVTR
jgi:hypothetical protein